MDSDVLLHRIQDRFPWLKLARQKTSLLIQKNSPHRLIFLTLCVISGSILLVCLSCFLRQFFLCFYTFKKIFRFLYFNAKYFQFLIFPFPDSNFLISVGQLSLTEPSSLLPASPFSPDLLWLCGLRPALRSDFAGWSLHFFLLP